MAEISRPGELQTARKALSTDETDRLNTYFERGLEDTRDLDTIVLAEKIEEYRQQIILAAEVAKNQFDQEFGGQNPDRSQFQVSITRPGYFGWNSWDNIATFTDDSMNNWIDGSTPDNLSSGGTGGFSDPLKIGEDAVHLICGVGSYAKSPSTTTFAYEINEKPEASIETEQLFLNTDLRIKWFDAPTLLSESDLFAARLYSNAAANGIPYLMGISFIQGVAAQTADPANMTDDTSSISDNIVAHT